jgi:Carboxypeptidase regulatory-like domain/Secretion system C-terminal sorting domain
MKRIIFTLLLFSFFNTTVVAQVTTVNEGFENWPPTDWGIFELGAAQSGWIQDWQGISHTGQHSAYSDIDNNQGDNWLVSPQINVATNDYEIKYWDLNESPEYYDKVSVLVSTSSGNPADGDFMEIFVVSVLNLDWEQNTIDLSSYLGEDIYVAFRYEGTWHKWFVDDVIVGPVNFTDGAFTEIVNPTGVSETATTEDVIVTFENKGTIVIGAVDIEWDVNGASQSPYNNTSLNLQPGSSIDLNIGSYNFSGNGVYNINADLMVTDDFNSFNDNIQGIFTISPFRDGAIVGMTPGGIIPNTGLMDIKATVMNSDVTLIESVEINWSVGGIGQPTFVASGLNLNSGESVELIIGQFNFDTGVYEISATLNVVGDINSENDTYNSIAAIDTFWESFEGPVFPPENWEVIFGIHETGFDTPPDGDYYYSSQPDANIFGVVSDTIYTPRLDIQAGDTFTINLITSSFLIATHSVVSKNPITGEVTLIQELTPTPDQWQEIIIDISAAQGINYIGVTSSVVDFPGLTNFDLFSSTAKLHLYDRDLAINQGDMNYLARNNINEGFTCVIKNEGSLPVLGSDYTIRLMESGTVLATVNGVNIDSWEEKSITVNHTFNTNSAHRLYFEIDYNMDENQDNNTFRETTVNVVPATVILDEMGPKDMVNLNFPFNANGNTNSLGEDDITESVFLSQEFENPGEIYGIIYTYDNLLEANVVKELPLKIWVSQTETSELSGGFLPFNELVLVFDGVVEILPGFGRELYIPFDQPISYTGIDNIVIQNYQYDPEWPPAILRFYSTDVSAGQVRTIGLLDVYDLDPANPGTEFFSMEKIPYTRFVIDPTVNYSVLSGRVYDTSNVPLINATVAIDGTSLSVQTDGNGNYSFPDIAYGTYDITASSFGYNDLTTSLTLDAPTIEFDFYLSERAQVEISGTVFGSNDVSIPLELVQVSIDGYITDNTTTDSNGNFTFLNVFGDSEYEVILSLYGYNDTTITLNVIDQNIDMGDIILEQEFISPYDVNVIVENETTVYWNNPLESSKVKLQNDLDQISGSYTNEPFEDVWLGNIITINDITTLTSVEFQTDIYQLLDGLVTIDIFDIATEEIIASSEQFIIYADSTQTIDIPNIVVYEDIAVMVHWQDNPASTNALTVDYSESTIENSAVIKYPGETFELLSDVVGVPPNSAFLVRINTLDIGDPDTNNETLTYNIYRGLASEFPDISNWDAINTTPVTGNSFLDLDWSSTNENEVYRFAVETIYNEGFSEVTFSNSVDGSILGINENIIASDLILYPVPASDNITIRINNFNEVMEPILIFDILGRIVDQIDPLEILDGYVTRSVSSFANGIYIVKINVDGYVLNKKFIVGH